MDKNSFFNHQLPSVLTDGMEIEMFGFSQINIYGFWLKPENKCHFTVG